MSARNMVRSLRDSGALTGPPPAPRWRSSLVFFGFALFSGAFVYLGAVYGFPSLLKALEKKPAPVSYAKPEQPALVVARLDAKPFGRADELACIRYGEAARKREAAQARSTSEADRAPFNLGSSELGALAAQLACEAQTRPMRLCDRAERKLFVQRSRRYFDEVTTIVAVLGGAMDGPAFSIVPPAEATPIAKDIAQQGLQQVAEQHAKVSAAFRDLAVRGLVAEADYANGILPAPDAVRVIFHTLPPVENACTPS